MDGTQATAAAALDLAHSLQSASAHVLDLAGTVGRQLDGISYEGPGANADRARLAEVAAAMRGFAAGLDDLASLLRRAVSSLPGGLP